MLKKSATNKQERIVLSEIFELKSTQTNKLENLRLNFHYINYTFCKENAFSNEKTSTLLAMLDSILNRMLEKQRHAEWGYQILTSHLADHSIQRPPFAIQIFSQEEV